MAEVQEILPDMEDEEALCYLYESVSAMEPCPKSDYHEIGYAAKFGKIVDSRNCKILNIIRHGSFTRNTLLKDKAIISELLGEDGSTGQKFKKTIFVNNVAHIKILKNEIASCLPENPIWKTHIIGIIEDIQDEFPNSEIEVSIFNPCTGVFTGYFATTKENGIIYLPSYHIIVCNSDGDRMYFGHLKKWRSANFPSNT